MVICKILRFNRNSCISSVAENFIITCIESIPFWLAVELLVSEAMALIRMFLVFPPSVTLPETDIAAWKMGHLKGKRSYSNHTFSGASG